MGSIAETIRMAGRIRAAHNPFDGDALPVPANKKPPPPEPRAASLQTLTDAEMRRLHHEAAPGQEFDAAALHLMRAVESELITKNRLRPIYPKRGTPQ